MVPPSCGGVEPPPAERVEGLHGGVPATAPAQAGVRRGHCSQARLMVATSRRALFRSSDRCRARASVHHTSSAG